MEELGRSKADHVRPRAPRGLPLIDANSFENRPGGAVGLQSLFFFDDYNDSDGCLTFAPDGGRVWLRRFLMLGGYSVLLHVHRWYVNPCSFLVFS